MPFHQSKSFSLYLLPSSHQMGEIRQMHLYLLMPVWNYLRLIFSRPILRNIFVTSTSQTFVEVKRFYFFLFLFFLMKSLRPIPWASFFSNKSQIKKSPCCGRSGWKKSVLWHWAAYYLHSIMKLESRALNFLCPWTPKLCQIMEFAGQAEKGIRRRCARVCWHVGQDLEHQYGRVARRMYRELWRPPRRVRPKLLQSSKEI